MQDNVKDWDQTPFPEMMRNLPEIDISIEGIRAWLLQGRDKQVVFFDIMPIGEMPPHSHCTQWGIVIDGKMSLTIGGTTKLYQKGDWYFIPAGEVHSAKFLTRVHALDVFDDPNRYSCKSS